MRTVRDLAPYGPAFIEQPVAPHDLDGMRQVRTLGLPVVADESVYGPEDVAAVIRAEAADVVSVYVGMAGGLGAPSRLSRPRTSSGLTRSSAAMASSVSGPPPRSTSPARRSG